jgi:hypothetical protein
MSLILNLRGTNGSGKSTAARSLIPDVSYEVELAGVKCTVGNDVCLIGGYPEGKTGGCDRVKTYDLMRGAIREAAGTYPIVLFESVTVSTVFGSWAEFCCELPFWWLYLDTPLDVCLARVETRNGGKPFNREMVADKMRAIESTRAKAIAANFTVLTINHKEAAHALASIALLG